MSEPEEQAVNHTDENPPPVIRRPADDTLWRKSEQASDTAEALHRGGPTFNQHGEGGSGTYIQAGVAYYLTRDFVRLTKIAPDDLKDCAPGRYLPPREAGQLTAATDHLRTLGFTVLCAPRGTGRRTTALKLLQDSVGSTGLFELEPEWSDPDTGLLPTQAGGYLLDLSGLDEAERTTEFAQGLLNYGREGLDTGRRLVVLVTPDDCTGQWTEHAPVVRLSSPNARAVVEQQLSRQPENHAEQADDEQGEVLLDDDALKDVWKSNPGLADARRLATLLTGTTSSELKVKVAEFTGWHSEIDTMLKATTGSERTIVATRAAIVAGALLNGANYKTILTAADALVAKFRVEQRPEDILSRRTASQRLTDAKLTRDGDTAAHNKDRHGLPAAILAFYWDEIPDAQETILAWAVETAASDKLTADETDTAVSALLELAKRKHEAGIVDKVGEALASSRSDIAARALTTVVRDRELGDYVKHRLLRWSKSSGDLAKLAAAVCGGEFGRAEPSAALTRLRWAAGSVMPTDARSVVVDAFRSLITIRLEDVERAVRAWLKDQKPKPATSAALLAISSSPEGAGMTFRLLKDLEVRKSWVTAWQDLLFQGSTSEVADDRLDEWEKLVRAGSLALNDVLPPLADVYEPELQRRMLRGFLNTSGEPETLREHILHEVLRRKWQRDAQTAV